MGALTVFYYLRSHIDWPITHFLKKHWAIPNRSSPFDQLPQSRSMIVLHLRPKPPPLHNLYKDVKVELCPNNMGTTWGTWETHWEFGENILGTNNKTKDNLKPPKTLK
jgi:hypothetical protein